MIHYLVSSACRLVIVSSFSSQGEAKAFVKDLPPVEESRDRY